MCLPQVKIEKSRIPIVWVDTSIITNMTIWQNNPEKLDQTKKERIATIYGQIYKYGRAGKIICPLADQEGEVWVNRDQWMNTIRDLSLGIECLSLKEIQDKQQQKAMQAYVHGEPTIHLIYLDAFRRDPVKELNEILSHPLFITVNYEILLGADYQRDSKNRVIKELNQQRKKNIALGTSFDAQLDSEVEGEINAIIKMTEDLAAGNVENDHDEFNKIGASINLISQLKTWEQISGRRNDLEGLVTFHKSRYATNCPYVNISCNLYAKIMTDPQPIRSGDPMDIKHISTLMPFSDLFITDKAWSTFLNNKSYGKKYNTTICYIGDTDTIDNFFRKIDQPA